MKTFCCCCSVRTGSLIIGTLGWIGSLYSPIFHFMEMVNNNAQDDNNKSLEFENGLLIFYIVVGLVGLLINVLLVVGIHKKNEIFMLPWIVLAFIGCFICSAALLFQLIGFFMFRTDVEQHIIFTVVIALYTAICWYFCMCVWSYYTELSESQDTTSPSVQYTSDDDHRPFGDNKVDVPPV